MTVDELRETVDQSEPPESIPTLVRALWHDASGNWERAHEIAQDQGGSDGAWVHAYLHRKEGDRSNASYWYNRAGKEMPDVSLEEEWEQITRELLQS